MTHYFVRADLNCVNYQYVWCITLCLKNGYNCALTSNGQNSSQSSLRDCPPGYNPQVGLNKIFHSVHRLLIFFHQQYKFSSISSTLSLYLKFWKVIGLEILQDPHGRNNRWSLDCPPLWRKVGSDIVERLATWTQMRFLLSPKLTKRFCLRSFHSLSILGGCIIIWMWYICLFQLFK